MSDAKTALAPSPSPFNFTRRFSIAAFASVAAVAVALGVVLARLVSERLLDREAVVTMEFVQGLVSTEQTAAFFGPAGAAALPAGLEERFRHLAAIPDVLRANVYDRERRAIWSSDATLVGRRFAHNDELDEALAGSLVHKSGIQSKEEHLAGATPIAGGPRRQFIEIYVPVRDRAGSVIGAVELYKTPQALFDAILATERTIALVAGAGGLLLFGALLGIVRRADRIMHDQHRRLLEGERLAAVGEMAAAVAHAIRNPLSSVRTSVEVALDRDPGNFGEAAQDIVAEVDKVEEWIRQLLAFSRPGSVGREPLDPNAIVGKVLAASERDCKRLGVRVDAELASPAPPAHGDLALVEHVLVSLVANALDAMPSGGALRVGTRDTGAGCEITLHDTGPGVRPEDLPRLFEPFFTTKARGTGLGLALARRIVERMGGSLSLENGPGTGALARLRLPA